MLFSSLRPLTYLAAVGFIFTWWTLAFSSWQHAPVKVDIPADTALERYQDVTPCPLHPFMRDEWHKALTGDVPTMMKLLAEWQVEAELLQDKGIIKTASFSPSLFLRAQELARRVLARERGWHEAHPPYAWQTDDGGAQLSLPAPPSRFLPQTELSAAILLTLCHSKLVALPARMRELPLFPPEMLARVPFDIDRYNSESLCALKPDVAFIAHYTQPSTVQTLRQQQITPFLITRLNSLEEILQSIYKIGQVVGEIEKAELLALFVQAGVAALEQRLMACAPALPTEHHPLYLEAFATLSAPTKRSLSGQLALRLHLNEALDEETGNAWSIPLNQERLHNLKPTWIVFSLRDCKKNLPLLLEHPLLKETPAATLKQIFAVEEAFQTSPTHFLLLAYYDLVALILPKGLLI